MREREVMEGLTGRGKRKRDLYIRVSKEDYYTVQYNILYIIYYCDVI